MIDAMELARDAVPAVLAALRAYGSAVWDKVRDEAPDEAADTTVKLGTRLLRSLLRRDKTRAVEAVDDVVPRLDDPDYLAALRVALVKVLTEDPELARQWRQLTQAAAPVSHHTIVTHSQGVHTGSGDQNNTFTTPPR